MSTINKLSLGKAATLTGKSKTTIHNAIKSGKLSSGPRGEDGSYQIDRSELERVYPISAPDEQVNTGTAVQVEQPVTPDRTAIDALNRLIEEKERTVKQAQDTGEHWRTEYQRAQNLLTDQRNEKPQVKVRKRRLTIHERLFGASITELIN